MVVRNNWTSPRVWTTSLVSAYGPLLSSWRRPGGRTPVTTPPCLSGGGAGRGCSAWSQLSRGKKPVGRVLRTQSATGESLASRVVHSIKSGPVWSDLSSDWAVLNTKCAASGLAGWTEVYFTANTQAPCPVCPPPGLQSGEPWEILVGEQFKVNLNWKWLYLLHSSLIDNAKRFTRGPIFTFTHCDRLACTEGFYYIAVASAFNKSFPSKEATLMP